MFVTYLSPVMQATKYYLVLGCFIFVTCSTSTCSLFLLRCAKARLWKMLPTFLSVFTEVWNIDTPSSRASWSPSNLQENPPSLLPPNPPHPPNNTHHPPTPTLLRPPPNSDQTTNSVISGSKSILFLTSTMAMSLHSASSFFFHLCSHKFIFLRRKNNLV